MKRALIVAGLALAAFAYSYVLLSTRPYGAADLTAPLGGASALLAGINPYSNAAFAMGRPYPQDVPFLYPLPAALLVIPLLPVDALSSTLAGAVFFGLSSAMLAYALTQNGDYSRFPVFLSPSFYVAALVGQWSPLLLAAMFLPWLMPLGVAKPNLFVGAVAYSGLRRRSICVLAVLLIVSLVVLPSWPFDWMENLQNNHHVPAVLTVPGLALIPALLFVRHRSARLLLTLAIVPQLLFWYDQLILWAIPRTLPQSIFLTGVSWIGYGTWRAMIRVEPMGLEVASAAPWVVAFTFGPAFALVIWQSWLGAWVAGLRRTGMDVEQGESVEALTAAA